MHVTNQIPAVPLIRTDRVLERRVGPCKPATADHRGHTVIV